MKRRATRTVMLGAVPVGSAHPVTIQSMTNTDTRDAAATLAQIGRLQALGCDIVRLAVPDLAAAAAAGEIARTSPLPVVADVHFDHKLALAAIAAGVSGIRINPGNIGSAEGVRRVAEAAGAAGIPIRVGANSGSLSGEWRERLARSEAGTEYDDLLAEALCRSALEECEVLEHFGFRAIKVALKASRVAVTIAANRRFAERTDYPLHLGVTEAGTPESGVVKSAVGIGTLLAGGVGDTIRVSLTAPPEEEIPVARRILEALELRRGLCEVIACPTCGRTEVDLIALARRVEEHLEMLRREGAELTLRRIAVMGCAVNGPGEAADADWGLAGGRGEAVLFRKGEIVGKYPEAEALARLLAEIDLARIK